MATSTVIKTNYDNKSIDTSCQELAQYTAQRFDDLMFAYLASDDASKLTLTIACISEMMTRLNGLIYRIAPEWRYFEETFDQRLDLTSLATYIPATGNKWLWWDDAIPDLNGRDTWDITNVNQRHGEMFGVECINLQTTESRPPLDIMT